jgi:hypothetical protein
MIERLALAAIAGAIGGYLLAKSQEPETLSFTDVFGDLMNQGELVEWDGETILQTVIEDEF